VLGLPLAVWIVTALASILPSPPPHCGSLVVEDTRLTADLVDCPGSGLVIGADRVVLDLAGHTLSGSGNGVGIESARGVDGVQLLNGNVEGFSVGIRLARGSGTVIRSVASTRATVAAIRLSDSHHVLIANSWASAPDGTGILIRASDANIVRRTTVFSSVRGIVVTGGSHRTAVVRSHVIGNRTGIAVVRGPDRTLIADNTVTHNTVAGIVVSHATRTVRRDNTLALNGAEGFVAIATTTP
jgi:Periplasmic copper-binding protein (NosD)